MQIFLQFSPLHLLVFQRTYTSSESENRGVGVQAEECKAKAWKMSLKKIYTRLSTSHLYEPVFSETNSDFL